MRTSKRQACYVCGTQGRLLYEGLTDRIFFSPGVWNFRSCDNEECGLVWLDPMPQAEDLGQAYKKYYTHLDKFNKLGSWSTIYRLIRGGLGLVSGLTSEARRLAYMYLDDVEPGRILDVGCGDGDFLARMRDRGWQVEGLDFDLKAVQQAQTKSLRVRCGDLLATDFPDFTFDAVTMSHVIEHLPDPLLHLQKALRILKPGGRLVAVTPNSDSWGHRTFQHCWRGLEPPRHLHIFSPRSLLRIAEAAGFKYAKSWTSCSRAIYIFEASTDLREQNRHEMRADDGGNFSRTIKSLVLQYAELAQMVLNSGVGEEAVLIASKSC